MLWFLYSYTYMHKEKTLKYLSLCLISSIIYLNIHPMYRLYNSKCFNENLYGLISKDLCQKISFREISIYI